MYNRLYIAIIIILIIGNLFLLNSNIERQNKINTLISSIEQINRESITTNKAIPKTIEHSEIEINKRGIFLLVIIPQNNCSSCLRFEIPNINKVYVNQPKYVKVYVMGKNDNFLKYRNIDFEHTVINSNEKLFDINLELINPVALLVDSTNTVYSFYNAEVGNVEKSDRFYNSINNLLTSIYY